MILQGNLSQVTLKKAEANISGRIGLGFVDHSMRQFGLHALLDRLLAKKGTSNRELRASEKIVPHVLSLIAGSERVEDIEVLRKDRGLLNVLGVKSMVGADAFLNYGEDKRRSAGLRKALVASSLAVLRESSFEALIYDQDATYFDSDKASASYSYQKKKQHSALLGFIAELGICITSDFRPGHISPQTGVVNQLRKAIALVKKTGKHLCRVRMDSAGHQNAVFGLCEEEGIEYFISLDKNEAVQECIACLDPEGWTELDDSNKEYQETLYSTGKGHTMRMLVLRWSNPEHKKDLFAPAYCYHAIGTNNLELSCVDWLDVHNGRMGSENYNKELKNGFNGSYCPSNNFHKNRFYFLVNVLAYNVCEIMKMFYLDEKAKKWTVKTLRFWFVNVCGKITRTARRYYCTLLNVSDKTYALYRSCLARLRLSF